MLLRLETLLMVLLLTALLTGPAGAQVTLWDQTAPATLTGFDSQNFTDAGGARDAFDGRAADDFVVPAGTTWTIERITALGFFDPALGPGPAESVNVAFFTNAGALPGAPVARCAYQNLVPASQTNGDFTIDLPAHCALGPGTYWVSVQANMPFAPNGQWFWNMVSVQTLSGFAYENPQDGFARGCSTFVTAVAACQAPNPDLSFQLTGTSQVGPVHIGVMLTGAGAGGGPHVRALDPKTALEQAGFFAFAPGFSGGVRVAAADVTGDGTADLAVAAGPGGGPHVRVLDGVTFASIHSFFAYDPGFTGGVFVAAGDVNGDGKADIITGPGPGGGPHVRVLDGVTLAPIHSFFAYAPAFAGGVLVGAGDVNGDGKADIITGPGPGGGPHVQVFDGVTLAPIHSFFAYDPGFTGGVFVAGSQP